MRPIGQEVGRRPAGRPATVRRLLDPRQPLLPQWSPQAAGPPPRLLPSWPLSWRRLLVSSFKYGLLAGGTFVALSVPAALPDRLVAIYALAAVIFVIDSQRSFLVALILLALVGVWSLLGQTAQATAYATYAFYFLAIGVLTTVRPVRRRPPP